MKPSPPTYRRLPEQTNKPQGEEQGANRDIMTLDEILDQLSHIIKRLASAPGFSTTDQHLDGYIQISPSVIRTINDYRGELGGHAVTLLEIQRALIWRKGASQ